MATDSAGQPARNPLEPLMMLIRTTPPQLTGMAVPFTAMTLDPWEASTIAEYVRRSRLALRTAIANIEDAANSDDALVARWAAALLTVLAQYDLRTADLWPMEMPIEWQPKEASDGPRL